MASDQFASAQDEPASLNSHRVWLGNKWAEPRTVCRDTLGRYVTNHEGNEPPSQLVLNFGKEQAA